MDKELACHDIALTAAKFHVNSNMPEYNQLGYASLVESLTAKYIEAYNQAAGIFDKQS